MPIGKSASVLCASILEARSDIAQRLATKKKADIAAIYLIITALLAYPNRR